MERKRGGPRFEEITIKIEKRYYKLINAVCGGDKKKINRLIRKLISESLKNKSVDELIEIAGLETKKTKKEQ